MKSKQKAKGSWGIRFFIIILAIALGFLSYWVLNFVVSDIGHIKGPDYKELRKEYVTEQMDDQKKSLEADINQMNRKIESLNEQVRNLKSSTASMQNTINLLLSIQKQSIEKGTDFPEKSSQTLADTQSAFLDNQTRDQEFNKQISELTIQRQGLQDQLTGLNDEIKGLEEDFNEEYRDLMKKHNWKVAAMKLAFLIPAFLIISFLFMKYRSGPYWSIVWAIFIAAFLKIAFVAHRYFPAPYFKYVAIAVVIAIVVRLLVFLIRLIIAPKQDLLVKQYQQLYDKCQCPVCAKPIRTGPLRYIGGMKKKVPIQTASADELAKQQPYTCPSCGTELYHKCEKCENIRHTLLPYCEHCGTENKSE